MRSCRSFPLDTYVDHPVNLMEVMPGDPVKTPIWKEYEKIVAKHDPRGKQAIGNIERFDSTDRPGPAMRSLQRASRRCMLISCCKKV
jgi:L-fucose mutarotase/ribose pyranase (RbsD/FucU family)